ncbi:head-tail connector protein [Sphingomonas sp. Tas61C01]|uniref:head-tail connector protein n=1 Tax=Sphingomonas sp. Tas61C01 TaxID=3458297 RepID=UPI00403EB712
MGGSALPAGVIAEAVAAAKAYLRLEGGAEDALLMQLAGAAIALAEAFCGQALVARGYEDAVPASGAWQPLPIVPVTAIDAVIGASGGVLPVGSYAIDIDAGGAGWVRVAAPATLGAVRVKYRAGSAATWDAVPEPIAQGVAMLVAHLFAQGSDGRAPPAAVAALWRPYRRLRLGAEVRR